jgi:cellulose synthase (UDP-forming)
VPLLVPLLGSRDDRVLRILTIIWLLALAFFWSWWLQPEHWVSIPGMVFNSTLLAWPTGLTAFLFFYALRATRPNPLLRAPESLRVALVVTKAPSEPFSVVRPTLEAMLAQHTDRTYAVWLADERPDDETIEWCAVHGVQVSTRFGVADYHRSSWPRRTKSKEGNLAYFYDLYGYDSYDVVAQFDADHVPAPSYLETILRPFVDPAVGYVAAPSICDANVKIGWTVRARLYKEATLHGVLQAGCNGGFAPVCIGSHYAVRTAALESIGGIGPELAEDYSTSFMMNSAGWTGTFAIDAEAHGDGPESFGEMITQELQWSRSLATVATRYTRGKWSTIPRSARLRLGFALIFYPLFGLQLLVGTAFPIVALAIGRPWVSVGLLDFWVHVLPAGVVAQIAVAFLRRRQFLRPANARLASWEVMLFAISRWPWILWGSLQGAYAGLRKREVAFKITPKGDSAAKVLPLRYILPMLLLALGPAIAINRLEGGSASGYRILCSFSIVTYLVVPIAIIVLHHRDNRRRRNSTASPRPSWRARLPLGGSAALTTAATTLVVVALLVHTVRQ